MGNKLLEVKSTINEILKIEADLIKQLEDITHQKNYLIMLIECLQNVKSIDIKYKEEPNEFSKTKERIMNGTK